jgi:hypothetical protein
MFGGIECLVHATRIVCAVYCGIMLDLRTWTSIHWNDHLRRHSDPCILVHRSDSALHIIKSIQGQMSSAQTAGGKQGRGRGQTTK